MCDRSFVLDVGGDEQAIDRGADFTALLCAVALETVEFAIVTETGCGHFVQAAGAYGDLVVEHQLQSPGGRRRHYRLCRGGLGRAGEARRPPLVPGYEGYLEKEVLSVADAVEIFTRFVTTLDVPARFETVEITEELGLTN